MWGVHSMQCHGNLNASKRSHLSAPTLVLEEMAVDTFGHSSCGTVVMTLFPGLLTAPSWHPFTVLAWGWAWATDRHTSTTSLGLPGATAVTHFSRFSGCLGCPLAQHRWPLWGAVLRLAAQVVPAGEVMRVSCDDTTKKTAGHPIDGLARCRHGAGEPGKHTARCGACTACWACGTSPSRVGLATAAASPWAATSLAKPRQPTTSMCRSSPAVRWPARSSTSWRRRDPDAPSGAWRRVALPPRTLSARCPRRPLSWGVSRSAPSAMRYHLPQLPRGVGPRAKKAP
jgi:hypothetical protein